MIWQMKAFKREFFIVLCAVILAGYEIEASTYNYSASIECLPNPLAPQYEGGLVANPKFDKGLEGWGVFGHGTIEVRKSRIGNQFIVAKHRTQPHDSFSQWLHLQEGNYYTFLAWVQINEGKETVVAAFRNFHDQKMVVGSIIAQCGCWSMLKGGFSADQTMSFELYFESNNTNIELWVDNISLQPFTKSQWREHQFQSIEKVRKRKLILHVTNKQGKKLEGAKITIKQTKPYFPLGCAIAETILENKSYQKWFTSRFPATTFDNEMKWYFTEKTRGHENYTTADAMLAFFKRHGISVRGHNIFWDNPMENLLWVRSLSPEELVDASVSRIVSLMLRYAGKVIAWDVMNENLHFSFFEDRIGENASSILYSFAQELDPVTTMFMNEYNTLEYPEDLRATPSKYIEKIKEIKGYKGTEIKVVGIGLQGHFGKPNIPYVRACLDVLGTTNMPIWLTELDVKRGPHQAEYLEEIMREAYSHPAVQGIIVWSGWKPTGCSNMCLTDNNFENLPTGDVVDKLLREWKTENLKGITNEIGVYEHQVFHGDYFVTIFDPYSRKKITRKLKVTKEKTEALNVRIHL